MLDLGRFAASMMKMDESVWARHANPWSGWSRVSILPLLSVAIWSRVWLGWGALVPTVLVLLWTLINPRLFPVPQSTENWMSRGVIGEQLWLDRAKLHLPDHHLRMARLLGTATFIGTLILVYGLIILDLRFALAGLATTMLLKLWFIDRMVWLYFDLSDRSESAACPRLITHDAVVGQHFGDG